jgi:hypothetical protein
LAKSVYFLDARLSKIGHSIIRAHCGSARHLAKFYRAVLLL